ncbi:PAS domain-containing protein [Streptomyces sp. NPDC002851]
MSSRPSRGAARLAAILDALPDALLLVNTNGTVVNANTIALQTFETAGWALVGRGLLDLLPEFDSRLIPGSMRRPDPAEEAGRTKPKRMIARRTDGSEFPVEVTSANLENSRDAYENHGYSGDELLMLVVRDLSGTVDTEAELARSQRQTEMILRAAAEGVVGTDTEGRVVLVNPAAAQILGYRASDLGGKELHPLVQHSRPDGTPLPYEESPLADTLRSGRKHRVRAQTLWAKDGSPVPVDLTTAPVRDGDQLVGAVLAFTDRRPYDELVAQHAEETARAQEQYAALAEREKDRYAALAEREQDRYEALAEREHERYEALAARHSQLLAVLAESLRGPLEELRRELGSLAADPAGQLWPEANQLLHHLSAGYARMTTLVDNVLAYQLLDAGTEELRKEVVLLDGVVAAGVEGATELIGPGRAQFAVHAPPLRAEVDPARLATALAHLIADVAGIDATGSARTPAPGAAPGGYADSTIVVAAAQRGEVVRIEVRGPYAGGDPVHGPIVRGIVRAHGGVLQTHQVPGTGGSSFVLEVPLGAGVVEAAGGAEGARGAAGALGPAGSAGDGVGDLAVGGAAEAGTAGVVAVPGGGKGGTGAEVAVFGQQDDGGSGRRARRSSTDAFLDNGGVGQTASASAAASGAGSEAVGEQASGEVAGAPGASGTPALPAAAASDGTAGGGEPAAGGSGSGQERKGRRRRRAAAPVAESESVPAQQSGETNEAGGPGAGAAPSSGTGRRRRKPAEQSAAAPAPAQGSVVTAAEHAAGAGAAQAPGLGPTVPPQGMPVAENAQAPSGRRARRNTQGGMPALPAGGAEPQDGALADAHADTGASAVAGAGAQVGSGAEAGSVAGAAEGSGAEGAGAARGSGRRARRALAPANERAAAHGQQQAAPEEHRGARTAFALPPAEADRVPEAPGTAVEQAADSRHDAAPQSTATDHTPPQPHPVEAPTGRRRARAAAPDKATPHGPQAVPADPAAPASHDSRVAQGPQVPQGPQELPTVAGADSGHHPLPTGPGAEAAAPAAGAGASPEALSALPLEQPGPLPEPQAQAQAQAQQQAQQPAQLAQAQQPQEAQQAQQAQHAQRAPQSAQPEQAAQSAQPEQLPQEAQAVHAAPGELPQQEQQAHQAQQAQPTQQTQPTTQQTQQAPQTQQQAQPTQQAQQAEQHQQAEQAEQAAHAQQSQPEQATPPQQNRLAQPLPDEAGEPPAASGTSTQGRAISVRTLGQGVPFAQHIAEQQRQPGAVAPRPAGQPQGQPQNPTQTQTGSHAPAPGSGRRRKLGTPEAGRGAQASTPATGTPATGTPAAGTPATGTPAGGTPATGTPAGGTPAPGTPTTGTNGAGLPAAASTPPAGPLPGALPQPTPQQQRAEGRSYAIGAPDEGAEGPEPLDGPNGAVEVTNRPQPQPMDDELPPEPLDNPRRLLVWPAPDVSTQQALSDRGYRPVTVNSRDEVDAQIAAFPAALFVDPLTGPITRTALQSLRQAAVAAEVPVLVTAGLGQASREAAYGADPAVLLKALAPRDSEQHPPRVLLIEEHEEIALALTATLERRGMQVARAGADTDAVTLATQMRPNLVVMDLMQVRRRRAGIVDWLRANGQLNRTPLVVYTAAVDQSDLPKLASGETVLFLAERSTSSEVQARIVDLLAKIGTN